MTNPKSKPFEMAIEFKDGTQAIASFDPSENQYQLTVTGPGIRRGVTRELAGFFRKSIDAAAEAAAEQGDDDGA